jgi:elongation factor G
MGESHIDAAVHSLEAKFGVKVEASLPKVSYHETISRQASAHYRHKKQTGGAGQFADVQLRVEPMERGSGFEYASEVFGGTIPTVYIPSIEKGIRQVLDQGVLAGFPIVDVKAVVFDGKYHPVDSKDIAFQTAGREGFKQAMREAGPALLEPIYCFTITVPEQFAGDVMGSLKTKRAQILGMDQKANKTIITAHAPLAEMQRYSTDLRSLTQGRGFYDMQYDHYAAVPPNIAQTIIAKHQPSGKDEDE